MKNFRVSNFWDKSTFLKSTSRFEKEFAKPAFKETLQFLYFLITKTIKLGGRSKPLPFVS